MGGASSKPARRLGTDLASKPATPGPGLRATPKAQSAAPTTPHPPSATQEQPGELHFTKDQYARDPQFLQNLQALGTVDVKGLKDRPGKVRVVLTQSDAMIGILKARAEHEGEQENSARPASLSAPELVRLLEEYKQVPTDATLDRLAIEYDVDRTPLGRLVRFVHAPDEQPITPH